MIRWITQNIKLLFKDHETKIVENLFDEEFYLKDIQNHKALVDTLFELTNKVKLYFQLEKEENGSD